MLRAILSVLLLLLSLLIVFKAPLHFLWLVAVVITNYPYVFMAAALLLLITGFLYKQKRPVILITSFIALLLYTMPVIAAYQQNAQLPAGLTKSFKLAAGKGLTSPFSFFKMFTGIGVKTITPQTAVYKTIDGNSLTADIYNIQSSQKKPLLVVLHGGSWESGDSKQFIDFNNYFANSGYVVAAINYRLAPAYKSPAPMEDTRDAVAYLTQHAAQYNIDTTNIILLGRSAGAQIALVAAYSSYNHNIKGVIDFYGPADMVWGGQVKTNSLMLDTRQIYKDYFGGQYNEVPQVFKANSACEYVNASTVPTLIIHGTIDPMVSHIHSEHLNDKLGVNKVPHYFLSLPHATHGCDYSINSPGGQVSTYAIEQFIQAVIKH